MRTNRSEPTRRVEFLAGYLPYLLNRVVREMLRGVDKRFQERGLTVSKWRILAILSDHGTCRFGELAQLTSIEPATLSRFVGALHRDGLIRRRRSASDARSVKIALTEKGEVAFAATLPWALEVENTLLRSIDAKDVARLKKMLTTMYANVRTEFARPGDDLPPPARGRSTAEGGRVGV